MVEHNKGNVCENCGSCSGQCGMCGNMCGFHGSSIIRWVFGILIIVWIFCIGMKFGEIRAYLEMAGFGQNYSHRVMPMMDGWYGRDDQVYFNTIAPAGVTQSAVAPSATGSAKLK